MKEITVSVTGAAGQIGYATVFRLASGEVFGKDTKINLKLLELETALPALKGVCMELEDCAFENLNSITATSDLEVAFENSDWALLVGSVPRKAGMERADLLNINANVFIAQAKALDVAAKKDCKVVVVGNPCNTNAYIAKEICKNIPSTNFFAMTMLDQKRAISKLANKFNTRCENIKNMIIWGNHSSTQYPNFYNSSLTDEQINAEIDWLSNDFISQVQVRGATIIKARGASSAASAANSLLSTVKQIITPTQVGDSFSLALSSDGSYGIKEGIIFSYPVVSDGSNISIVQGVELSDFSKQKIKISETELIQEADAVSHLLG